MDISYFLDYKNAIHDRIALAQLLSMKCHSLQFYYGNHPYFLHCLRVSQSLDVYHIDSLSISVALLHDILEDTILTEKELKEIMGFDVTYYVKALTRKEGQTYFEYINEIKHFSSNIPAAVKLADLKDNLKHSLLHNIKQSQIDRYKFAINMLK